MKAKPSSPATPAADLKARIKNLNKRRKARKEIVKAGEASAASDRSTAALERMAARVLYSVSGTVPSNHVPFPANTGRSFWLDVIDDHGESTQEDIVPEQLVAIEVQQSGRTLFYWSNGTCSGVRRGIDWDTALKPREDTPTNRLTWLVRLAETLQTDYRSPIWVVGIGLQYRLVNSGSVHRYAPMAPHDEADARENYTSVVDTDGLVWGIQFDLVRGVHVTSQGPVSEVVLLFDDLTFKTRRGTVFATMQPREMVEATLRIWRDHHIGDAACPMSINGVTLDNADPAGPKSKPIVARPAEPPWRVRDGVNWPMPEIMPDGSVRVSGVSGHSVSLDADRIQTLLCDTHSIDFTDGETLSAASISPSKRFRGLDNAHSWFRLAQLILGARKDATRRLNVIWDGETTSLPVQDGDRPTRFMVACPQLAVYTIQPATRRLKPAELFPRRTTVGGAPWIEIDILGEGAPQVLRFSARAFVHLDATAEPPELHLLDAKGFIFKVDGLAKRTLAGLKNDRDLVRFYQLVGRANLGK